MASTHLPRAVWCSAELFEALASELPTSDPRRNGEIASAAVVFFGIATARGSGDGVPSRSVIRRGGGFAERLSQTLPPTDPRVVVVDVVG